MSRHSKERALVCILMADTTFGVLFNDNINTCKYVTCDPELVLAEVDPSTISAPMVRHSRRYLLVCYLELSKADVI